MPAVPAYLYVVRGPRFHPRYVLLRIQFRVIMPLTAGKPSCGDTFEMHQNVQSRRNGAS